MLGKTAVYQFWSAEGELLYVGISKNFSQRVRSHIKNTEMWPAVDRAVVRFFESRMEALSEERRLILENGPRYNYQWKRETCGDLEARIFGALKRQWATPLQIAAYVVATPEEIKEIMSRLTRDGKVVAFGDCWFLPEYLSQADRDYMSAS